MLSHVRADNAILLRACSADRDYRILLRVRIQAQVHASREPPIPAGSSGWRYPVRLRAEVAGVADARAGVTVRTWTEQRRWLCVTHLVPFTGCYARPLEGQ